MLLNSVITWRRRKSPDRQSDHSCSRCAGGDGYGDRFANEARRPEAFACPPALDLIAAQLALVSVRLELLFMTLEQLRLFVAVRNASMSARRGNSSSHPVGGVVGHRSWSAVGSPVSSCGAAHPIDRGSAVSCPRPRVLPGGRRPTGTSDLAGLKPHALVMASQTIASMAAARRSRSGQTSARCGESLIATPPSG